MFIDSVIWIALKYKKDKWHKDAIKLRERILEAPRLLITDGILTETYNFLLRKSSYEVAIQTYQDLIYSGDIGIIENNSISRGGTTSILKKYNHLSYTDANIIWHCQTMNIKEIMSFDKGFDKIKGIVRIKS